MNARSQFAVRTLVAAISACFAGGASTAPQAPTVVAGQAGFQQSGNTLTITNTPGTIINWQSFSINRDEVVRFLQQSASSQVLNRVTGIDPSVILGQLQSNGRVLLINPNGVLFGRGSQIDVAGLLVSTLQLKDADFLAGRYKFNDTPGAGSIDNQGTIRTQSGGHVILIAPKVENSGLIQSPEGHIMLAAGRSVTLADPDKPAIQVEVTNRDNTAVNLGTLIAKNVTLYGGIIRNSGLIQATTAVVGENGKIRLQAKYDVENTGTLQASGTQGGDILLQAAEGVARVQGTLEAKGSLPPVNPENGPKSENAGKGGRIEILAPEIVVDGVVDASGTTGGGAVFIGGQYQGGNNPVPTEWSANPALQRASLSLDNPYASSPSVTATTGSAGDTSPLSGTADQNAPLIPNRNLPTARTTTIGANARIRADGLEEGDGGVVVAWSDESTHVVGLISARGGANAGNGGLIETSGKIGLSVDIPVDASAAAGRAGLWLLDPNNIQITSVDANITGNPDFTSTNNTATINAATIQTALNAGTNVTISTGTAGTNSQAGDILVSSAINVSPATTTKLTLQAHNNITFTAGVSASGAGALNLELIPDSDASGAGKAIINSTLSLNGGALSVLGSGTVDFIGSTINASTITATTANFSSGSNTLNAISTFTTVNASGGSQTGSGALTAANLSMTSGSLGGSGGITITNSLNWQSGTFYGPTVLASGATANLTATGTKALGANFTNDGTLNVDGGRIQINSGFTLQNSVGATINLNSTDSTPINFGTGNATFNNLGTLNQLAVGTHEINLSLGTYNNSGTVNVQAGTLRLRNTGTDTGNYVLAAGATLEDYAGATRTFSGSITGGGTFSVTGATATIGSGAAISSGLVLSGGTLNIATGAAQTISTLSLTGGTLNATDSLTVTGAAMLSGGTLTGNLTTQGTSTLGMFYLASGNWTNQGVATLGSTSSVVFQSGTNSITNASGATVNLNTTSPAAFNYSSGTGTFNNAGTLVQQASGVHEIYFGASSQFNNSGLVSVQAGTLQIGTPLTSTGTFDIAAGATVATSRNWATPYVFAAGSSVTGSGTLQVPTGTMNIQGTLGAGLTLGVSSGTLNLTSGASQTVSSLNITSGALNATDSLTVTGAANLTGGTLSGSLKTLGTSTIGLFSLSGANWTNEGIATLGGSSYIYLQNGTNVFTNAAGATLNLNTSNSYAFYYTAGTGVFNNAGTVVQQASGAHEILLGGSSQFNNSGLVSVQAGTLQIGTPGTSTGVFDIASGATLEIARSFTPPTTFAAGSSITGSGTFKVSAGTVTLASGSTISTSQVTVSGGSLTLNGNVSTGSIAVSGGTLNLNDGAAHTLNSLSLTGGTLSNTDALTVTGLSTLGAGTLAGAGSLTTQGTTTLPANFTLATTWNNEGTATLSGASSFVYLSNGTLNNLAGATLNLNSGSSQPIVNFSGSNTVNNAGLLTQQASGSHSLISTNFTNTGTVDVQAGSLQIQGNGTDSGSYSIALGTTLSFVSGTRTINGTISGAGTLQNSSAATTTLAAGSSMTASQLSVSSGTLTVNGTVSPSSIAVSGGTLNLNDGAAHTLNSLSLTGGTLNTADALTVTGAATLGSATLSGTGSLTTQGTTTAGGWWFNLQTTWNNAGYATLPSAGIYMTNGTINNLAGATFDVSSTYVYPFVNAGGVNAFNNAGTLNKLGSASVTASLTAFNNTGAVNVQGGTLALQGGTDTGAYSIAAGATLESIAGTRLMTAASSVGGSGTLKLSSGTLQFLGTYNLPSAPVLAGGTLDFEPVNSVALGAFTASSGTYIWGGNTSFTSYLNSGATTTFTGAATASGLTVSSGSVVTSSAFNAGSVAVSGGTLSNNGTTTFSSLALSGGTLNGSGTLTATNTFNWTGGVMSGTGVTKLAAGGVGTITTTNQKILNRTLRNEGTITVSGVTGAGFPFRIENGGVIDNASVFNIADDSRLEYSSGAVGQILNTGTFAKTGGTGSSYVNVLLNNNGGTLQADTGLLDLVANTTLSGTSTINGNVTWRVGANVTLAGDVIGTTGLAIGLNSSSATLTANGNVSVNKLSLGQSGILTGAGTLTVTDSLDWTGGVMSGTGVTKLAAGGIGTITTTNTKILNRTLRNEGTITVSGVTGAGFPFRIENGGVIDNASVFNIADDSRLEYSSGAVGQILNTGTFAKTGGTGSSYVNVPFYNNAGILRADSGILSLYQSLNSSGTASIDSGAGVVSLVSGTGTLSGAMRIATGATLSLTGATLNLLDGAALNGPGNFTWTSGTLNVTGASTGAMIGSGLTLNIGNRTISGAGKLTNLGTVLMSGGALNANFVNAGQLTVSGTGNLISGSGAFDIDGGTITLNSGATLTKSGGTVNWHGGTLSGAGNLSLTSGATFNVNGSGARVLNGPSLAVASFNLAGGSLDVQSGSLALSGGTVASGSSMSLHGGTVTNSGPLAVAGTLNLAGGTLAGPGALNVSGTLQKASAGTTTLAMVVNNAGTVDVQAGVLNLAGGGTHSSTFLTHTGTTLGFTGGTHNFGDGAYFSGAGNFVGGGTMNLTGTGAGLTVDAGTSVNLNALGFGGAGNLTNAGTLTGSGVTLGGSLINTGIASLTGATVNGGLSNTGTLNVIGTVTLGGSASTLAGGSINLGGGATLVKDGGTLYWSGGTFGGSGTLAYVNGGNFAFSGNGDRIIDNPNLTFAFTGLTLPNGSLTLNNGGLTFNGNTTMPAGTALNLYGGAITNNGPLDIGGVFGLYGGTLAGAGAINMNGGTIDLPANSTVNWTATGPMSNSGTLNLSNRTITNAITNNGTINTTGGLIFTQLFTNQGVLNLNSGTTTFSAGILQNSGSTKMGIGAGTSANMVAGGSGFTLAGGTLSGSGNIAGDLSAGNSVVSVGFSPGSLSITGNLNLSAGSTTNIELGGTTPGTGYDTITVTGTANLAGTLNVTSYGGYTPAAGSSYNFMSFGSSSGAFGSTNLPAGWSMSLTSMSTYLSLLMAAAQGTTVTPLQALIQAMSAATGGTLTDPGTTTMGGTSLDFSRVTPNDLATSLMQQMMSVTQVLPSTDFEDLKVCQ